MRGKKINSIKGRRKREIVYIAEYVDDPRDEDYIVIKELKKHFNVEIVNTSTPDIAKEEKLSKIKLAYNASPTIQGQELAKELQELGVKVINKPETLYFSEDKWLFYLKCKEHKIPTPETILLSDKLSEAKKEIKKFLEDGEIVIKSSYGYQGKFVEKASNISSAVKVYNNFKKKTSDPLIAQRFITNNKETIRVTMIDNKIVQTVLKQGSNWKVKGSGMEVITKINPDKKMRDLAFSVYKLIDQDITGMDIIEKDGEYQVLEVNGVPSLTFIKKDIPFLIKKIIKLIGKRLK